MNALLFAAAIALNAQADRFPLAEDAAWTFRGDQDGAAHTIGASASGFVRDFPGLGSFQTAWAGGSLYAWTSGWSLLFAFDRPGAFYRFADSWVYVEGIGESVEVPALGRRVYGCTRITIFSPAAVRSHLFAPGVGPVFWESWTPSGYRSWRLIRDRPAGGFTLPPRTAVHLTTTPEELADVLDRLDAEADAEQAAEEAEDLLFAQESAALGLWEAAEEMGEELGPDEVDLGEPQYTAEELARYPMLPELDRRAERFAQLNNLILREEFIAAQTGMDLEELRRLKRRAFKAIRTLAHQSYLFEMEVHYRNLSRLGFHASFECLKLLGGIRIGVAVARLVKLRFVKSLSKYVRVRLIVKLGDSLKSVPTADLNGTDALKATLYKLNEIPLARLSEVFELKIRVAVPAVVQVILGSGAVGGAMYMDGILFRQLEANENNPYEVMILEAERGVADLNHKIAAVKAAKAEARAAKRGFQYEIAALQ